MTRSDMEKISEFRGEYYFLSNFWRSPVVFDGITYPTAENAFQAQKSTDPQVRAVFATLSAYEAKRHGRRVALRPDWEEVKYDLMLQIVREKFLQHKDLAQKLKDTKDAYLEEYNTWGDQIWGVANGSGQNLLGKILMQVREELNHL